MAVLLVLAFSAPSADAGRGGAVPAASSRRVAFTISGHARRLSPGVPRTLQLRIGNPSPFAIVVGRMTVDVRAGGVGCSRRFVQIGSFVGSLRIPARGSVSLGLPITLLPTAPDACQGVRFPLEYHGKAGRA